MGRKNISITNDVVEKALDEAENASKLIEKAILYYLEFVKIDYLTADEVEKMIDYKLEAINNVLEILARCINEINERK